MALKLILLKKEVKKMNEIIGYIILFDYYVDGIKHSNFEKIILNPDTYIKDEIQKLYIKYGKSLDIDSIEVYQCKKLITKISYTLDIDVIF